VHVMMLFRTLNLLPESISTYFNTNLQNSKQTHRVPAYAQTIYIVLYRNVIDITRIPRQQVSDLHGYINIPL
jgi:hypothetical protein